MATKAGREREMGETKLEEILLHHAGKPATAMKDGGQNVIENEAQDDLGRPMSHPTVARTNMNKKLSEAALTFNGTAAHATPERGSCPARPS